MANRPEPAHGEEELLEEFRRDAVELYRVTVGATITAIAGDLGITDATLSAWIKAAGVPVRGRHAFTAPADPRDELARLRSRVAELEEREKLLSTEKGNLEAGTSYAETCNPTNCHERHFESSSRRVGANAGSASVTGDRSSMGRLSVVTALRYSRRPDSNPLSGSATITRA